MMDGGISLPSGVGQFKMIWNTEQTQALLTKNERRKFVGRTYYAVNNRKKKYDTCHVTRYNKNGGKATFRYIKHYQQLGW